MNMKSSNHKRTITLYCSNDMVLIQHLSNHLDSAEIPNTIVGQTATTVMGVENLTQQICIRIFNVDVIRAKAIIKDYLPKPNGEKK